VAQDLSVAAHATSGDKVRVIDLASGQERWSAKAAEEGVKAIALSSDGKIMATGAGYSESTIRLWDVAMSREIRRLEGHRSTERQGSWFVLLVRLSPAAIVEVAIRTDSNRRTSVSEDKCRAHSLRSDALKRTWVGCQRSSRGHPSKANDRRWMHECRSTLPLQ
jgi:WD40 repeat protein